MKCLKLTQYLFIGFLLMLNNYIVAAQAGQKLDSLFSTLAKQGYFNGCVLIAEDGKPMYEKAFGYANFETKQLLDNQTMFELASVSKQFTAMAIMQLHEKGKLGYDDDLKKYFPQIPFEGVTINNLLRHTSGIPEFLGWDERMIDVNHINYNKDILAAIIKNKTVLNFRPGETLAYSNTNYVLLALIVEKVSGLSFSEYMDKNIFKPLGMEHTSVYPQRAVRQKIDDYAYGYLYDPLKAGFVKNDSMAANRYEYYFDGVAGPYGISSNIEDMLKWDQALYTDKLISQKEQSMAYVISKLNNGKDALLSGIPYGFGWLILPPKPETGRRYMHSGGYPGYMTIINRFPDKKKTIILLINIYNVINLYALNAAVTNILFDKPFIIPTPLPFKKSLALNPAQLKIVEGTYTLSIAPLEKITITNEAGQTYAQITGQPKVEIYPERELEFFYEVVTAKIKFIKDDNGVVNKLILKQAGKEFEWIKEEN